MKNYYILFLIILNSYNIFPQQSKQDFFEYFEQKSAPFNTNEYNRHLDQQLPNKMALKYIFRNKIEASKYYYEIYSDEDNSLTESGFAEFKILSLDLFNRDSDYNIIGLKLLNESIDAFFDSKFIKEW